MIRWCALADGICDATIAVVLEQRKTKDQRSDVYIKKQMVKVENSLAVLDRDINKKKWCVDETFSLSDIAVGCMLGYIDLRFKDMGWQAKYPNLSKHYTILSKRPSFKKTAPVSA